MLDTTLTAAKFEVALLGLKDAHVAPALRSTAERISLLDWRASRDLAVIMFRAYGMDGWVQQLEELGLAEKFGHEVDDAFCARTLAEHYRRWANYIEAAGTHVY